MDVARGETRQGDRTRGQVICCWAKFLFLAALIACMLVPTFRAKMTQADLWFGESSFLVMIVPQLAAGISRRHAELELFYSLRPIFAAATDSVLFAVWVFSLSRFGPVRNRDRAAWLCVLAAICGAMAVVGSLLVSQRHGPELGWKCFDSLFLVVGGTIFFVYLLMVCREWRESRQEPPAAIEPIRRPLRKFALRWADMFLIVAFLATVKDVLLMVLASVFALDAPTHLVAAIRNDDVELVRRMVDKDRSLANCRLKVLEAGLRPVHLAILFGRQEVLYRLLQGGADPDGRDGDGRTALSWAALADDNGGMVAALLARGAAANLPNRDGQTPLILATRKGNLVVARVLLRGGANPNKADATGRTALHYAAEINQLDLAQLLVAAGASAAALDDWKRTPAQLATAGRLAIPAGEHGAVRFDKQPPAPTTADDACLCTTPDKLLTHTVQGQLHSVSAAHDQRDYSLMQAILSDANSPP